ncbi:Prolyl-tRNA synthetase 2 [mine drainage metagenome]|uniref:proline--tRNA ligase n=1 Tax=mine drainage metagenome TaxID=410659 RepID=T0ZM90_9ZZZZ
MDENNNIGTANTDWSEASKPKGESTKTTFSIDKVSNFPEWYDRALDVGDIVDTRYPVKGMYIWKPYGYKALKSMLNIISNLLDSTGHEEAYFPMMVPESVFGRERDFLKGFNGEAYIVTKAGESDLAEKLYVRPTSETIIYESVRPWIRSFSDLPMKLYQIVNIFRYETKQTRPMLRLREITKFKEAHTFHATADDAEKQVDEGVKIYSEFFDKLMIPFIVVKTPSWDTFAGAMYNYDMMSVMPDGKAIELASVINLGTKFAKAFGLTYRNKNNELEYVHQTCYGVSERELGVLLAIHGDNKGLILPPVIAPVHVVIVPVFKKGKEEDIRKAVEELRASLESSGFRIVADLRDKGVGDKYYEWEAKGVPVRVEIGPKELETGKLVILRRDKLTKETVDRSAVGSRISELMGEITENIKSTAQEYFKKRVFRFKTIKELKEKYTERLGMVSLPWCGDEACGKKLETDIDIPTIGFIADQKVAEPCASCGNTEHSVEMFFGRTY